MGTGGAGKAENGCQPGQEVKDKSQRKWHGLIKVSNRILNLSEWHCSEGDKGVEEKNTQLSLQIGPVVICALMQQLLLLLWRKGASPVLLYGLSAAKQEDLSALILSSERGMSGPICHRLLWEWHGGDDLLTRGWLAKKAPPQWFFH